MKQLFLSLLAIGIFYSSSVMACPNRHDNLICPGDSVVSELGWEGTVTGVNPFKKKASVRWHRDGKGSSVNLRRTHYIRDLANAQYCDDDD